MTTKSKIEIEDEVWDAIAFERDTPDAKFLTHEEIWNATVLSAEPGEDPNGSGCYS
jgi:hypothetical protein